MRRSYANGFQLRGNYTWSKNLDDGSAWNTSVSGNTPAYVEFPLDPKLDWGLAATDVRQSASINGSYDLPFGPNRRFLNHASGAGRISLPAAGPRAPFSPCRPASRSRRSLAITLPATATRAIPSGPVGTLRSPAISIRARQRILQSQRLHPAHGQRPQRQRRQHHLRHLRQCARDSLTGPGLAELDFSAVKEHAHHRAARTAVPRRVLQHSQPHQLPHAERGRVFLSANDHNLWRRRNRDCLGGFTHSRALSQPPRPHRGRFSSA